MSVIVKGMEMPKNCRICPMLFDGHNYRWCNITGESLGIEETDNGRDEHCPLIEIPTPHGRLGDLDELKTAFPRCDNSMDIKIASVRATINHAPTIIEAEGSET